MKKILTIIIAVLAAMPLGLNAQNANARTSAANAEQSILPVLADIIDSYAPWGSVEFNGKLIMDKLPVKPSVKIYMERDSLLQISLRVPLMGEVGRLSLTRDELLIVNKMKKRYCQEDASKLYDLYPGILSDLQSIFLARVVVFGEGELSEGNAAVVKVEEMENGNSILVPETEQGVFPVNYGYIVGPNARTLAMLANLNKKGKLEIRYEYENRGMQMKVAWEGKKRETATLDFSSVKWGGTRMSPVKLGGYEKVGIRDILSNLK